MVAGLEERSFRAFVAVEVGALAGVVALLEGARGTGADLKVVEPTNVHVTLKFVGDLDVARVGDVTSAIRAAARDVPPFECALEGVGSFGPREAPRVLWVGLRGAEPLGEIAARLDEDFAKLGVAEREGRAFKPHVTLARSRSERGGREAAAWVRANSSASAGLVRVADVRLMRSDLSPAGPRYSVVERVPLGGA